MTCKWKRCECGARPEQQLDFLDECVMCKSKLHYKEESKELKE